MRSDDELSVNEATQSESASFEDKDNIDDSDDEDSDSEDDDDNDSNDDLNEPDNERWLHDIFKESIMEKWKSMKLRT